MELLIHFEDIKKFVKPKGIKNKISDIFKEENRKGGSIGIIFCSDAYLLHINQDYLSHDYYTDVITFDYTEDQLISGDILISVERVRENSQIFNSTFENELLRVIIHGVLHLLGYNDQNEKEKAEMRQKEDTYIEKWINSNE
jgi:rRNA maturation RNase YbeY